MSANKANRAAKARAALANTKSAINPTVQNDKQPNAPTAAVIVATLNDNVAAATKVAPGGVINGTVDSGSASAINISGPAGLTTLGMTLTSVTSNGGSATGILRLRPG